MIFYFIFIIAAAAGTGSSTIFIKHYPNTQYMHKKMIGKDMGRFPEKLQITIYLTKLPGLLFYGFYKTDDVVCILEERQIQLTSQGQHYSTSLQELCKCDPCLYQPLTFTFQVNDIIQINCNGNEVVKNKLPPRMHGHSIHSFTDPYQNELIHLYLINIPPYINHTYQYETLAGCIHQVKYTDIVLEMDRHGLDMSNKCTPHCDITICNGGRCLETFDDPPLCDCQFAYKNGDYCNSELWHGFNVSINFQFQVMKLSWNSSVEKILVVSDDKSRSITVLHRDHKLQVSLNGHEYDTTVTIKKNYSPSDQHIMIISIDKPLVNMQYKSHKMESWINMTTLLPGYSFHEEYSSVIFLNNRHSEKGDIVYKTFRSTDKWRSFRNIIIDKPYESNIIINKIHPRLEIIIAILSVAFIIMTIGMIIILIKYKICRPLKLCHEESRSRRQSILQVEDGPRRQSILQVEDGPRDQSNTVLPEDNEQMRQSSKSRYEESAPRDQSNTMVVDEIELRLLNSSNE